MGTSRSRLSIILLSVLIDLIGFGIVIPILPLYAQQFGANEVTNGFLICTYSLLQMVAAPVLGRFSDHWGRRPILMVSMLGTALGFLCLGLAGGLFFLFLGRLIDGLTGGTITTAQAYIADVTPPEERARAMGLVGMAFGLGFVLGPAIGGLLSRISIEAPFYFAATLALLNIGLVWKQLPESLPEHPAEAPPRQTTSTLLRSIPHLPRLLVTHFLVITGFSIMTTNFALFTLQRFGYKEASNAYLFAFIGIIGVIMQGGVVRRLLKTRSERSIALVGGVFLTLGLALLPLTKGLGLLLIVIAIIGTGNSFLTPTLTGLSSRLAPSHWQGQVMGLMQSAGSCARAVGPVTGGLLLALDVERRTLYGVTPFWAGTALLIVATLLIRRLPAPGATPASPLSTTEPPVATKST